MVRSIERDGGGARRGRAAPGSGCSGPSARAFDALSEDILRPILHLPRHPLRLARFGLPAAAPATLLARRCEAAGGAGAVRRRRRPRLRPLTRPFSAAVGMALICACHSVRLAGRRAAARRSIADALAAVAARARRPDRDRAAGALAGRAAGTPTRSSSTSRPRAVAEIAGDRLPRRVARAYRRYKHGPGAFKVDLAVEGGVPWTDEACRRAGTVHAVGSFEEIVAAERDVNRGRMPERPFVLVGQQYLADPPRSAGDVHPVWAYAHVPNGYDGDGEKAVLDQIERFAPGLRERIVATATRSPADFEADNPNYVGGDIVTGANTPLQIVFRPRLALDPYATGVPGLFICSAATPPGGGVHGMGGYNAAQSALRHLGQR